MIDLSKEEIRNAVRSHYSLIAKEQSQGCGCDSDCCSTEEQSSQASAAETSKDCGCSSSCCSNAQDVSQALGYSIEEIRLLPEGANLGLGCGNPQAIAALKPGETVLDLGSGAGIDCFLAARAVTQTGKVIGVDMTHEMLSLARKNAEKSGFRHVEFRLGEIENLPVADASVDVILSNCVVNLSPDKRRVFQEAFRVLKSGGRLAISDMVASGPIPEEIRSDLTRHSQCISGATPLDQLSEILAQAGFVSIRIKPKSESATFVKEWAKGLGIERYIVSATIEAVKP